MPSSYSILTVSPYELTFEAAQDAGLKIDKKGFDEEMKAQKERARKARGNFTINGFTRCYFDEYQR